MKCPNCQKYNKNGIVKCFYCGFDLPQNVNEPAWLKSFDGKTKNTKYISVDEFGNEIETQDYRDKLAEEMVQMRHRTKDGKIAQEHFKKVARRRAEENRGRVGLAPKPLNENTIVKDIKHQSEFAQDLNIDDTVVKKDIYEPAFTAEELRKIQKQQQSDEKYYPKRRYPKRKTRIQYVYVLLTLILFVAVGFGVYSVIEYRNAALKSQSEAKKTQIIPSLLNDMSAHTIKIPGEEGAQIYIKELHKNYLVTNGYATIEVADYNWYENYEDYVNDTMEVSMTPFLRKTTGKLEPLEPITYTVDIPLSPLTVTNPQSLSDSAYTSIYKIGIKVRQNSKLSINGVDYSDIVNTDDGNVVFNANIKPIGENKFEIVCKAQYSRSNKVTVVINRPQQDIPVDLASDISSESTYTYMTIRGTTIPGAYITVQSPHTDLDITNVDVDGSFKFLATFNKIGTNVITFSVAKAGLKTTVIEHKVYYVPNIDIYSRKAWAMDDEHYNQLVNTINERVARSQIYVCIGTIEEFIAQEPQIAIMNCGTEEKPLRVLLENKTKKTWVAGKSYRVYADIFGLYKDIPRLTVRYSYPN